MSKTYDELSDETYDKKWYDILDRLAKCWVNEGRKKKRSLELEYKLGLFVSEMGKTEYASKLRDTYGI